MRTTSRTLAIVAAATLFAVGCGGSGDDEGGGGAAKPAPQKAHPRMRIVSLSPSATELLYAIGAGDEVVAVDDQSTYPKRAPRTKLSGLEPNAEAIAGYRPDLVVASADVGGLDASLDKLGIDLLVQSAPTDFAGSWDQARELGRATHHAAAAAKLVRGLRRRVDAAVEGAPKLDHPLTYYHELDPTLYTATSDTFIGAAYARLGLRNIADSKGTAAAGGYPQLSAEYVLDQDPDLIFLADTKCCGQDAATVAKRAGWGGLQAVRSGAVVELDDDVASRWGPRSVELLEDVAARLATLPAAQAAGAGT
ncbi:MAG: transporter substrate-binding protein [Thermoleophilia bacterium]|nr:transporter substrate-binding protein [Thermoleophilia bacterium]